MIGSSRSSSHPERSPLMPRFLMWRLLNSSAHSQPSVIELPRKTMSLESTGSTSNSVRLRRLYSLWANTEPAARRAVKRIRIRFMVIII